MAIPSVGCRSGVCVRQQSAHLVISRAGRETSKGAEVRNRGVQGSKGGPAPSLPSLLGADPSIRGRLPDWREGRCAIGPAPALPRRAKTAIHTAAKGPGRRPLAASAAVGRFGLQWKRPRRMGSPNVDRGSPVSGRRERAQGRETPVLGPNLDAGAACHSEPGYMGSLGGWEPGNLGGSGGRGQGKADTWREIRGGGVYCPVQRCTETEEGCPRGDRREDGRFVSRLYGNA